MSEPFGDVESCEAESAAVESAEVESSEVESAEVESAEVEFREGLPEPAEFVRLFRTTGWRTALSDERLAEALASPSTWHCVCAYERSRAAPGTRDRLVGMGRTISDGALHALIVEAIVEPEWQGRGIGRAIMRRLVERCRAAGIDQVQLFCADGKRGFYERLGFAARQDAAPGMELIG